MRKRITIKSIYSVLGWVNGRAKRMKIPVAFKLFDEEGGFMSIEKVLEKIAYTVARSKLTREIYFYLVGVNEGLTLVEDEYHFLRGENARMRKTGEALSNLALKLLRGGSTDTEELEKLTSEWKEAYDERRIRY